MARNQGRLTYPFSIVRLTDFGISASHPSRDGNVLIGEPRMLPNDAHVMSRDQGSSGNVVGFGPTLNPSEGMSLPNPAAQDLNQRFSAIDAAVDNLAKEQEDLPGRVILVWVGPGWPPLPRPQFLPDTREMQRSFFAYVVDLSTDLREAQHDAGHYVFSQNASRCWTER